MMVNRVASLTVNAIACLTCSPLKIGSARRELSKTSSQERQKALEAPRQNNKNARQAYQRLSGRPAPGQQQ